MAKNLGNFHTYKGQRYLVKYVKPENYFRKYDGYSIAVSRVDALNDDDRVILALQGGCDAIATNKQTLLKFGKRINYAGMGKQIVLPISYWEDFEYSDFKLIYNS